MIWYISLIEDCNWKCKYCDFTHFTKNKKVNKNYFNILKILKKYIKKDDIIALEGGEIGLIEKKILENIFELFKEYKIKISTNGLFIKKYFKDFDKYIDSYYYHVIPEIELKKIKIFNTKKQTNVIVITKDKLNFLDKFLKINDDIKFDILAPSIRYNDNDVFDIKEYKKLIQILDSNNNVHVKTIKKYKEIVKLSENNQINIKRKLCSHDFSKLLIDITNEEIQRCCMSYTRLSRIPLTEKNIKNILNNKNIFKKDSICNNCNSTFIIDAKINLKNIKCIN